LFSETVEGAVLDSYPGFEEVGTFIERVLLESILLKPCTYFNRLRDLT
jgi:hypothetical protein